MNRPLTDVVDEAVSLEAVKLYALLKEVDRVVLAINNIYNAIRSEADRNTAALEELRPVVRGLRQLVEELRSIADATLPDSITKRVSADLFAVMLPHINDEVSSAMQNQREMNATRFLEEQAAREAFYREEQAAREAFHRDNAQTIADAIAGKPPLPALPPADARLTEKIRAHTARWRARLGRTMISTMPPVVLMTCLFLICCGMLWLRANSSLLKF